MRTREEALALYRKQLELLEGLPLPPMFSIEFSDEERGAPMAYIQEQGIVGLKVEPVRYWRDESETVTLGLNSHEMANFLHWPPPQMQIDLGERIAEVDRQYRSPEYVETWQRRINRLRWEYEHVHGLLIVTLADKLWIDADAAKLLVNAHKTIDPLVEFLLIEREEEFKQVEPVERKPGRVFVAETRLAHARLLARGDDDSRRSAEDMRRFYERWSRKLQAVYEQKKALSPEPKTPSTS